MPASRRSTARITWALSLFALVSCSNAEAPEPAESSDPTEATEAEAAPASTSSAAASLAPSFDCTGPSSTAEELVCSDSELAALDLRLDSVFRRAVEVEESLANSDVPFLRAFQRGWAGGRDECWKESDVRACVVASYIDRTVTLQAEYLLVPADDPVFWSCEGNPANEFVTTLVHSEPATLRVERGDQTEVGIQRPAASGTRYEIPLAREFWMRGDEARVVWPEGTVMECVVRTSG